MLQKILKSSSKFEMGSISTCEQFRCQNCSKCEQFSQQNFSTFFKAFHSVNFLLTNSHLVFVCLFVLSCLQSCQGGYLFLSFSQSCQGWNIFFVKITPLVNNFDKKVIFNWKGQDIKLLNIKLLNYIGLDFLYNPRYDVP